MGKNQKEGSEISNSESLNEKEIEILVKIAKMRVEDFRRNLSDEHPFNRGIDEIETIGELRDFVNRVDKKMIR